MVFASNGHCIEMKKNTTRWFAFAFLIVVTIAMLVIGCYQSVMLLGPQSNGGMSQTDSSSLS
jgi:hypothetical protein